MLGGPGSPTMHGLQLWVALPDTDRRQAPHFEHHAGLPRVRLGAVTATVVLGRLAAGIPDGVRSPAATYSPILGADLALEPDGGRPARGDVPLDPVFEHGVLAVEGDVRVDGRLVERGSLLHLPPGRRAVTVSAHGTARAFLLGGEPFGERLVMWWNFVGRDHDDIARARADWEADRRTTTSGARLTEQPASSGESSMRGPSAPSAADPSVPRFAPVDHPAPGLRAPALPTTRLLPR